MEVPTGQSPPMTHSLRGCLRLGSWTQSSLCQTAVLFRVEKRYGRNLTRREAELAVRRRLTRR